LALHEYEMVPHSIRNVYISTYYPKLAEFPVMLGGTEAGGQPY